jgi:hypothetical protein
VVLELPLDELTLLEEPADSQSPSLVQ